jgi:glutamate-1-semialdehyde aminotransferase
VEVDEDSVTPSPGSCCVRIAERLEITMKTSDWQNSQSNVSVADARNKPWFPMSTLPQRPLQKSNAQFARAVQRLPLGVSSTFRYWGDDRTIHFSHGKGGRTWDFDGNNYVDYRLGYGPAILGYADDRVDAAARKGMEVGGVFALSTERELIIDEVKSGFRVGK